MLCYIKVIGGNWVSMYDKPTAIISENEVKLTQDQFFIALLSKQWGFKQFSHENRFWSLSGLSVLDHI